MATVTYLGETFPCSTAIKGADYIHLLNSDGIMTDCFEGIVDFTLFSITDGTWADPAADDECSLAVIDIDGTIRPSEKKCSEIGIGPDFTASQIEEICDFEEGMTTDEIIPVATDTLLGCVVVGDGLEVDENGKLDVIKEILWENATAAPGSTFINQQISMDASDYDVLEVVVNRGVNATDWALHSCFIHLNLIKENYGIGATTQFLYGASNKIYGVYRTFQYQASVKKLNVTAGYIATTDSNTVNNGLCVPVRVYGIKHKTKGVS